MNSHGFMRWKICLFEWIEFICSNLYYYLLDGASKLHGYFSIPFYILSFLSIIKLEPNGVDFGSVRSYFGSTGSFQA